MYFTTVYINYENGCRHYIQRILAVIRMSRHGAAGQQLINILCINFQWLSAVPWYLYCKHTTDTTVLHSASDLRSVIEIRNRKSRSPSCLLKSTLWILWILFCRSMMTVLLGGEIWQQVCPKGGHRSSCWPEVSASWWPLLGCHVDQTSTAK